MPAPCSPKVVLQDCAKASVRVTEPRSTSSWFVIGRLLPTWTSRGHGRMVDGVMPESSSPVAVTTLNVEPGGYTPDSARLNPGLAALATARISAVVTSTTTIAVGREAPDTASSAARWTAGSMVVWTARERSPRTAG